MFAVERVLSCSDYRHSRSRERGGIWDRYPVAEMKQNLAECRPEGSRPDSIFVGLQGKARCTRE